ncbi:MAG: response regulator transcription factor [Pseudomonadales bacterium]|nr:response regulator transcription factor [Pseudomonadales bacterium]
MTKLLIIDDDIELAALFKEYLEQEHFKVDVCHNGSPGLDAALTEQYALIILDIMLPDITGTQVLIEIRKHSAVPVLMFTAKGDDIDRIIGLESGADDYVPKPCSPRELVARIRAILRRTELTQKISSDDGLIANGPLKICNKTRKATWFDTQLSLTSTEFNLLYELALNAGDVVSKHDLSMQGLGRPPGRFDRSIDVHISSIRQKLGQQEDGTSYIQTIRGQGYQFIKV